VERIAAVHVRLDQIDAYSAEANAAKILAGLGFGEKDLHIASKNFSGGWRMRIALAKTLFCNPDILLLDEPTNHLDLDAVMWLEDYVESLNITVIIVSHARDFLNKVC
jgi:ATP-binding cassette subfamily F protein 3